MDGTSFKPYETNQKSVVFAKDSIVPRMVMISHAPTQRECLIRANENLEKAQKKGMARKMDPRDNMIARNIAKINKKGQKKLSKPTPIPEKEVERLKLPQMKRASTAIPKNPNGKRRVMSLSTIHNRTIQNVIHDVMGMPEVWNAIFSLEKLPYTSKEYKAAGKKLFIKELKSFVTDTYNKGLESNINALYIKKKAKEIQRKIVLEYIRDSKINMSKMSRATKREYLYTEEMQEMNISDLTADDEDTLLQYQLSLITNQLPHSYRTDLTKRYDETAIYREASQVFLDKIDEMHVKSKTTPVSPRAQRAETPSASMMGRRIKPLFSKPMLGIRQSKSKEKIPVAEKQTSIFDLKHEKLPRDVLIKNYWTLFDPLDRENKNNNYAVQLNKIVDSVNFDYTTGEEEVNESLVELPEFHEKKEEVNEDRIDYVVTKKKTKLDLELKNVESDELVDRSNLSLATRTMDDINLLLKSNVINELMDKKDDGTHDRLSKIWDEFGFTVNQKLSMALKYSDTGKCYMSISESIDLWEDILVAVNNYKQRYADLKRTVKFSAGREDIDGSLISSYYRDLDIAESNVRTFNSRLKNLSGDNILIDGKDFHVVFAKHRKKLRKISGD